MAEESKNYSFFQNRQCEYFPCHSGVDEADFNCLFCYCPLYLLGSKCGGKCSFNEKGCKICEDCNFPHMRENYEKIVDRYGEIMDVVKKIENE